MNELFSSLLLCCAAISVATSSGVQFLNDAIDHDCAMNNSFVCEHGKCISIKKRCDGIEDCANGLDEKDCDVHLCDPENYFRCKNNKCVHRSFICNGDDDCGDYSDEEKCGGVKSNCTENEWRCLNDECISKDFVCNDDVDCSDGSDETLGCTLNIECSTFKCNNGHCIPNEWHCDGVRDCIDNSDELDCETYIKAEECTLEKKLFLCANNKTCLQTSAVCDGEKQCPDGSDESPLCNKSSNSCNNYNCSHQCVQLPSGPKCICPPGYHTIDEKHCSDINECEIYGICDQKCLNIPGSYQCYCDKKYQLQEDKRTCKVTGGDALLIFSSKSEIRGYFLQSQVYFPLVKKLKHVVGVNFDGQYVYWTDIYAEHESIVRSLEDGSQKELLITSGLGFPEDLAVDWVTGNIYFTDAELHHIGVCTNDGLHCTVLVNKDIDKPRGIVLNPAEGEMFWSDWGKKPEIARSRMDGSDDSSFVSNNIHWPNGLAIDYPNQRLYWVDAKQKTVESIRLDGTDRRVILEGIIKHPYSIAVFENRLYWSDWLSRSIQACDKFTGKNHHTLVKEKNDYIYGMHIFHSALKPTIKNPCLSAACSDICLLNGKDYTCACPQNKILGVNRQTCADVSRKQVLIVGAGDTIINIEHQILGKHDVTALPTTVKEIGAMAYDSFNNTLFVSDLKTRRIIALNMNFGLAGPLAIDNIGEVTAMDFDYLGNNLYWCDSVKSTVEVFNVKNRQQKVILHDMDDEIPKSIALIPEEGVMFIAFEKKSAFEFHIDRLLMDGTTRTHIIEQGLLGPISLIYDRDLHRIFWADAGTGNIESTSIDGDDRHGFKSLQTSPISLASLNDDIFWANRYSKRIYWSEKRNEGKGYNKKITLDLPDDLETLHLISIKSKRSYPHDCQNSNGNCSHLCLVSSKSFVCACPLGMKLNEDGRTCYKPAQCDANQFFCKKSNLCISKSMRCDGNKDCPLAEDEDDCKSESKCLDGYFECDSGKCIDKKFVCDHHYDCKDKSDENRCEGKNECSPNEFECSQGNCISISLVCDGIKDCSNGKDEGNCMASTCKANEFQCNSGTCIPKNWECDHQYDCADLSDEHDDCVLKKCSKGKFTCTNGRCIDASLKCDKADDCGDNSDEISCDDDKLGACNSNEMPCSSNTSVCVPFDAECNGTSECPHHEDEQGCSDCDVESYECGNKKCIPTQWLCDHVDDCGDGSDESPDLCLHHVKIHEFVKSPCPDGFLCKTGQCIDFAFVCNGEEDCYDGSDEYGACVSSCQSRNNPCSQICLKTPSGPMCKCNPGYQLKGNGHSCVDIEECSHDPPICSQKCKETSGSFTCDCYDGFILRSDRKSCKSTGEAMSMIFTVDNQIRQLSQTDNSLNLIYVDDTPKITGLDVSVIDGYIYFSIEDSSTLHRINLKSRIREFIADLGQPQKIALDWISDNIYYIDANSSQKSIRMCNFDEKLCATILELDKNGHVSAFVVDAVNKYIFYTVAHWMVFNSPSYVLYRCNLDGTKNTELVKSTAGYINGLAYDLNKHTLYYLDQYKSQIHALNYDGINDRIIISNLSRLAGLSLFEDHLYFFMSNGYMGRCKLFGVKRVCDSFKLHVYSSQLFAIYQQSKQPPMENVCEEHNCTYLCVSSQTGARCICEDGQLVGENEECKEHSGNSRRKIQPRFSVHSEMPVVQLNDHNSAAVVAGVLIPLLVLMAAVGSFYAWRKRRTGKFDISLRFHNPIYGLRSDSMSKPILQPGQHEYSNPVEFCINDEREDFRTFAED